MTRATVVRALQGHTEALSSRSVAELAGLPYKATIDALGWLYDTGVVVRIGRKYNASWALAGSPASPSTAALDRLEAAWRVRTPPPRGRPKTPPGLADLL